MQDIDSSSSSSRAASPIKNASEENDMKQDNFASPLIPFIGNDPNQMVILSGKTKVFGKNHILRKSLILGPFPSEDRKSNVIIARPIPPRYTVSLAFGFYIRFLTKLLK